MQRLRSPFRLRPGPGAEQRKGKARREQHGPYGVDSESPAGVTRSSQSQDLQQKPSDADSALTSRGRQQGAGRQELGERGQEDTKASGSE